MNTTHLVIAAVVALFGVLFLIVGTVERSKTIFVGGLLLLWAGASLASASDVLPMRS